MPLAKLYFTPGLLLLVLSCPLWQVSQSLPVMSKRPMNDSCVLYARTLLWNITDALAQNNLFIGINCTKQSMELNMKTNTPSVCAPRESTCSGIKSEFDQDSCLTNIWEDLLHYYKFLAAQPDPDTLLGPTVLLSLRELMNCFTCPLPTPVASVEAPPDRPSTYDERLSLCKVLKGFQVRTITINRVIAYMNAGEHTKLITEL